MPTNLFATVPTAVLSSPANKTRIAFTPGEPAGIGPDLAVMAAQNCGNELVTLADPDLLEQRARSLRLDLHLVDPDQDAGKPGYLRIKAVRAGKTAVPGQLDTENAAYVLRTLDDAASGCLDGEYDAMVTGPVQKSVINDAGISFSGHTEYLAQKCGDVLPVMMLATDDLRVCLYTTHMPLSAVSGALNGERLKQVIRIIQRDLEQKFAITHPRIAVCGLNPHAGESGHLGREEIDIMQPAIDELRHENITLSDPLPADTAFTREALARCDVVLAMFHDQGLPVIKHSGFGQVVNITLGLPIIRTSVDHGTALDLAGSGKARADSLLQAIRVAGVLGRNLQRYQSDSRADAK